MKKTLLMALAVSVGFSATAQNRLSAVKTNINQVQNGETKSLYNSTGQPAPVMLKKQSPKINAVISSVNIGSSTNAFGTAFGAKTALYAHPAINAVSQIYRSDINNFPTETSGYLRYNVSTDGGATWGATALGPIYSALGGAAPPLTNSRYPMMCIYNPTGNTDPNSAILTYGAPTLSASNGAWGGIAYGSQTVGGVGTSTSNEALTDRFQVPGDMCIAQGTSNSYIIDIGVDGVGTLDYVDSVVIFKGSYNGTDYTYTTQQVYAPVALNNAGVHTGIADMKIAFGPDGQTGYFVLLGHADFNLVADSNYAPIVYKTIDGGNSWTNLGTLQLDACDGPLGNGVTAYTTAFEVDVAVDINGNCHIICAIGPSTNEWSISNAPGTWGIFDFYSGAGNTWNAQLIGKPQTFRGSWTDAQTLSEDSRPQIARTWAGDKLFFNYFDTDTTLFGTPDNLFPDIWAAGFDVVTCQWTANTNLTGNGSNVNGICIFGNIAPYVFGATGTYTIPASYLELTAGGPSSQSTHYYIQGLEMTDAQFNVPCTPVTIVSLLGTLENPSASAAFSVTQNSPNPFNGITSFNVSMTAGSDIAVEVVNTIGQVVQSNTYQNRTPGTHTITIDGTELNAGIYYYIVSVGGEKVTNKMIVK